MKGFPGTVVVTRLPNTGILRQQATARARSGKHKGQIENNPQEEVTPRDDQDLLKVSSGLEDSPPEDVQR
ncbi:hypothetical protein Pmani_034346 [Petrolisthes manimaculis]|uniref:Uncharacterized protein n=1 Tax=Petrolisthes manimaculis TaxID=1843537 RepID=A0AAE1NPI9_9EUCA|nr:hypothetical protein Pmani_034346 [Petrolisthes manimaculis]